MDNRMKLQVFLGIITIACTVVILGLFMHIGLTNTSVDSETVAVCQEMARQNTITFAHTEFAHMNFYQSCIDNVRYDSPLVRR